MKKQCYHIVAYTNAVFVGTITIDMTSQRITNLFTLITIGKRLKSTFFGIDFKSGDYRRPRSGIFLQILSVQNAENDDLSTWNFKTKIELKNGRKFDSAIRD